MWIKLRFALLFSALVIVFGCGGTETGDPSTTSDAQSNSEILSAYATLDRQSPVSISELSVQQVQVLFGKVKDHPVASQDRLSYYDPTGASGFCFGRAMAAHLIARKLGLSGDSIRKLFVVGDLRQRGAQHSEWRFHVTTLVKVQGEKWYAVDPIFPRAMTMDEWIESVKSGWDSWRPDGKPHANYYLTHRDVIMPDTRALTDPAYETGKMLGEISFKPTAHAGFQSVGPSLYSVSSQATTQHFMSAGGSRPFDFSGIAYASGYTLDFRGYFGDLMTELGKS